MRVFLRVTLAESMCEGLGCFSPLFKLCYAPDWIQRCHRTNKQTSSLSKLWTRPCASMQAPSAQRHAEANSHLDRKSLRISSKTAICMIKSAARQSAGNCEPPYCRYSLFCRCSLFLSRLLPLCLAWIHIQTLTGSACKYCLHPYANAHSHRL